MNNGCNVGLNACDPAQDALTRCYGCGNRCCKENCSKLMHRVGFGLRRLQKVRVCNDCQEDRRGDFTTMPHITVRRYGLAAVFLAALTMTGCASPVSPPQYRCEAEKRAVWLERYGNTDVPAGMMQGDIWMLDPITNVYFNEDCSTTVRP